jgi:hypothetical protein
VAAEQSEKLNNGNAFTGIDVGAWTPERIGLTFTGGAFSFVPAPGAFTCCLHLAAFTFWRQRLWHQLS